MAHVADLDVRQGNFRHLRDERESVFGSIGLGVKTLNQVGCGCAMF